jgi:hypothetical protein
MEEEEDRSSGLEKSDLARSVVCLAEAQHRCMSTIARLSDTEHALHASAQTTGSAHAIPTGRLSIVRRTIASPLTSHAPATALLRRISGRTDACPSERKGW